MDANGVLSAIYDETTNALRVSGSGGGGAVSSVNTRTGAVVLTPDDLSDAASTNKWTTAANLTKLAGIATGATANSSDATLLARANHTGTQAIGTISGLGTGVATLLATPSSANLLSALTDKTGTGVAVFATSPTLVTPTTNNLTVSGNISAAAWTTAGIRIKVVPATLTDTSSSGTVATAYTSVYGGNTIAASAATTFTNYFASYLNDPVAGTNVTLTNKWALGADSAKIGTSSQLTVSTAGVVKAFAADQTFTAGQPACIGVQNIYTLNFVNAYFGGGGVVTAPGVIDISPTVIAQQSMATIGMIGFKFAPTVKNLSSVAANLGAVAGFSSRATYTADTQSVTLQPIADYFSRMTFSTTGGGTLTASSDYVNFEGAVTLSDSGVNVSGTYACFAMVAPTVTAGTLASVTGLRIAAHAAGATLSTGIDIQALTSPTGNVCIEIAQPSGGSSANIGIRNAGNTVNSPTVQAITAVTDTIPILASTIRLNNTSGSSKTLTSAPTIATGSNGQILRIFNSSANDVVLQDQTASGLSTNLRLGAATRVLTTRDSITLLYSTTVGDWVELTYTGDAIKSASPTYGIGYSTGAGGAVTQATDKSTGVTLNTVSGKITMNAAALAASTSVGFTLTNSTIAVGDTVSVSLKSAATVNAYVIVVDAVAAGSCHFHLRNTTLATSLSEAVVINYNVIKGVSA